MKYTTDIDQHADVKYLPKSRGRPAPRCTTVIVRLASLTVVDFYSLVKARSTGGLFVILCLVLTPHWIFSSTEQPARRYWYQLFLTTTISICSSPGAPEGETLPSRKLLSHTITTAKYAAKASRWSTRVISTDGTQFAVSKVLVASEYHVRATLLYHLTSYTTPRRSSTRRPQSLSDSSSSPSRILIVSAFLPVPQANRPPEAYLAWLTPFLRPILPRHIFLHHPDLAPSIGSARGPGLPLVVDTSFASPFDIPPLKRREVVYGQMHKLDEERAISSPELFRDEHGYTTWPDPARIQRVWEQGTNLTGTEKKDLIFFPVVNPLPKNMASWVEDSGPISSDFSGGSFFGGPPAAMAWKDETIYNALLLLFPSRFITVWPYDPLHPL
ncbi:hypothetical protein BDZ97DRAFT_2060951 [Flammula alnicola]|nr:hypothetical protein BDZ97DRAFT_2060951 [Flammula alnicola]